MGGGAQKARVRVYERGLKTRGWREEVTSLSGHLAGLHCCVFDGHIPDSEGLGL